MTAADEDDMPEDPAYAEFARRVEEFEARMERTKIPPGYGVDTAEGTEGPREDPYGWTSIDVVRPDGTRIRYKTGMIEQLWLDGEEIARDGGWGSDDSSVQERFELLAGFSTDQLEWWAEAPYRGVPCMACGAEGCRGRCQE